MAHEPGARPGGARFPTTHRSVVLAALSENPVERARAFERIAAAYWKPVYKYLRLRWQKPGDAAADLTQDFFATAFEKDFFGSYEPAMARFRTFLRVCLDRFASKDHRGATRLKRGGAAPILSLDFETAEGELAAIDPPAPDAVESYFDEEWTRSLFSAAVASLRAGLEARGKLKHFRVFERYDLEEDAEKRPTYAALAAELSIAPTDVTNYLSLVRREFRGVVLDELRALTASEEEFRSEALAVLGVAV